MENLKFIPLSELLALSLVQVFAQAQSPKITKEELATNNGLFVDLPKKRSSG
jgi:hypothetical protein